MDIKNLYTLKTILEEDGFNNAASKLGYTQSTITFQIRQLEEELGIKLFERIGRKMVLTKAGESVLPFVDETLAAYEKLHNIGKSSFELKGDLNIILSETLLCYRMNNVIKDFHLQAPNIRLKLRTMGCYATKQMLIDGNADIGICYDEHEKDERLVINSLGESPMSLVTSASLYEKLGSDLLDFRKIDTKIPVSLVTDEPNGIFRLRFEKYLKVNNISLDSTVELWSTETIKAIVMSDVGIAYLPRFVIEKEINAGTMIELPHNIPGKDFRMIYAYHKNKYISPQLKLFMDLLEKYTKNDVT